MSKREEIKKILLDAFVENDKDEDYRDRKYNLLRDSYYYKLMQEYPNIIFDFYELKYYRCSSLFFQFIELDENNLKKLIAIDEEKTKEIFLKAIEELPSEVNKIEKFISDIISDSSRPDPDFVNFLNDPQIIEKLIEVGYIPQFSIYEGFIYREGMKRQSLIYNRVVRHISQNIYDDKNIIKILDNGFIPTIEFLAVTKCLKNERLIDRIFEYYSSPEKIEELINSDALSGCITAQRRLLKRNDAKEIIKKLASYSPIRISFINEALKSKILDKKEIIKIAKTADFELLKKLIEYDPDLLNYNNADLTSEQREIIGNIAVSMGYVAEYLFNDKYKKIGKYRKIVEELIKTHPWIIVKAIPDLDENSLKKYEELALQAINKGFIPTRGNIQIRPYLTYSYEIMKMIIKKDPSVVLYVKEQTNNKEELLKQAIANGFSGELKSKYVEDGKIYLNGLNLTETGIMYQIGQGKKLLFNEFDQLGNILDENKKCYSRNYSIKLFEFLIEHNYNVEEIFHLFDKNEDTLDHIISKYPEYIKNIDYTNFDRATIDKICITAIEKGYTPTVKDEIFFAGLNVTKLILKQNPFFIDQVKYKIEELGENYDEMWKIVLESKYGKEYTSYIESGKILNNEEYLPHCYRSYTVMKKLIPLYPDLIELCEIEDQNKFEELCKLSKENGYQITKEYEHSKKTRLYSCYELVKDFLPTDLINFYEKLNLSNPEQIREVVNKTFENGDRRYGTGAFNNISTKKAIELALNFDEEDWPRLFRDNLEKIKLCKEIKKLGKNNYRIPSTLKLAFFKNTIFEKLSKKQQEIISCYPSIQEKMLSLTTPEKEFIFEALEKYKDDITWINFLEKILNNMRSFDFLNIVGCIGSQEFDESDKKNLLSILISDNHIGIESYDELHNIKKHRKTYIEKLLNNSTEESVKNAYLEKLYGINLIHATNLVNRYGKCLETKSIDLLDRKSKNYFKILKNIKKIININDLDILKAYYNRINKDFERNLDFMVTYEQKLKDVFIKAYNDTLTKPKEEDRVRTNEVGEENLDIFLAAGKDGKNKCRLMITSVGAYNNNNNAPINYSSKWNVNKITQHGCCCSYVGECNLGTAEIKHCCLGFTDYDEGTLHISAPYDLDSKSKTDSYEMYSKYLPLFMLPDDMLEYTRNIHNEMVWERRNIKNNQMYKKQPSYIVYFVDNFDDRLKENSDAQIQWEETKKAAEDFGIIVDGVKKPLPIMVVEREKIAQSQKSIIENKINDFKKTHNPELIKEIISGYESNYAGNVKFHENIMNTYFPKCDDTEQKSIETTLDSRKISIIGIILEEINKISEKDSFNAEICLKELEKTVLIEKEKYSYKQSHQRTPSSFNIEETIESINKMKYNLNMRKKSVLNMIEKSEGNTRSYEQEEKIFLSEEDINSQLTAQDVTKILEKSGLDEKIKKIESEIRDENTIFGENKKEQRNIKNVILFSAIIGNEVLDNEHDMDLLLEAAKYHDMGIYDEYKLSKQNRYDIIKEKLKNKSFSAEDIEIILKIIETIYRSINDTEKEVVPLYISEKIETMADIIVDAEILDRNHYNNLVNPFFLNLKETKKLIAFSSSIKEKYCLEDLDIYDCSEALQTLYEAGFTPQEIIKKIEKNINESTEKEDIENILKVWASENKNKDIELLEMFDEVFNEDEKQNTGNKHV